MDLLDVLSKNLNQEIVLYNLYKESIDGTVASIMLYTYEHLTKCAKKESTSNSFAEGLKGLSFAMQQRSN